MALLAEDMAVPLSYRVIGIDCQIAGSGFDIQNIVMSNNFATSWLDSPTISIGGEQQRFSGDYGVCRMGVWQRCVADRNTAQGFILEPTTNCQHKQLN